MQKIGGGDSLLFFCKLDIFYIAQCQYKDVLFAEEINAKLISLRFGNCPKNLSHTFSMVHLLHRLYGVDAPDCI